MLRAQSYQLLLWEYTFIVPQSSASSPLALGAAFFKLHLYSMFVYPRPLVCISYIWKWNPKLLTVSRFPDTPRTKETFIIDLDVLTLRFYE